jgi:hypothetical protein
MAPPDEHPHPSPDRLRGQLEYLFEDDPALRHASPEQLAERLNHDDRWARARARYPLDSDAELRGRLGEFDDRLTVDEIRAALARVAPPDD